MCQHSCGCYNECNCGGIDCYSTPCSSCCTTTTTTTTTVPCTEIICDEVYDSNCVVYNGPNLTCYGIEDGATLTEVLDIIINELTDNCTITTTTSTTTTSTTTSTTSTTTTTTTDPCVGFNCIDHDVTIGSQIWTGCNLNVLTYRNGDSIPEVTDPTEWIYLTTGAWCWHNNDINNGVTYGKLYNWYAVNDPRGLAPEGYHIPSDAEWTTLTDYLGGESIAAGALKEEGLCHWDSPNDGATNATGFAGLPGGNRNFDGNFYAIGGNGVWWSSTEYDAAGTWYRLLNEYANVYRGIHDKTSGFSVRLIKD